jgi:beta-lactamase regulating signal transducer with metallopeptidase domain
MTLSSSDWCVRLLGCLAEPALRTMALAALAGLALALGRARDAAVRLAVWTSVLYAALAMPFLERFAPAIRLPMPALQAARSIRPPAPGGMKIVASGSLLGVFPPNRAGAALVAALASAGQPQGLSLRHAEPSENRWFTSWPQVAITLYLLLAGVLLGQLAVGFYFSRRVRLFCNPIGDRRVLAALLEQSTRSGLKTAPGLAESPAVAVPVTLGAWRPTILFPTVWRVWSEEKIQAVLAHELSHVVRKDALTRALAAIHRSVFWFSPLAWWLERHLAMLAEQASDDAALRTGSDRVFYAEVLLGFYQDLQSAAGRVRWEGVAMTRGKQARKRVDRILDSSRRLSAGLRKPAWAALALLAAPLIYLLAGAQPVAAHKLHRKDGRALAAPMTTPTAEPLPAAWQAPSGGAPAPAPVAPAAPKPAPNPAPAPQAPTSPESTWGTWSYGDRGEEVVISYGSSFSGIGSFHGADFEHFRMLRRMSKADIVWFRRDGKAYVIRDAATIEEAKAIWAPQRALSEQQEELGRQQEALGAQQEELGKQMEQVRVPIPDLTAELQKLQAQLEQFHKHGATQEELGELQGALGNLQGKLGEIQGKVGERQGEIGAKQGELGERQGKLGEQQGKLGEQQARLAKEASKKMKALLNNALAKGLAQPE